MLLPAVRGDLPSGCGGESGRNAQAGLFRTFFFYSKEGGNQVEFIISVLLSGIAVGGQYALIAIGYTMVYGILRLINFAHRDTGEQDRNNKFHLVSSLF